MKLNPPETAPMNGKPILASFYLCGLSYAIWAEDLGYWVVADADVDGFDDVEFEAEDLRGWLPMPKIDKEGK